MNKNFIISSVCVLMLFGTSCTITQPIAKSKVASTPEFIDGFTMDNGNTNVQIKQHKQSYEKPEAEAEEFLTKEESPSGIEYLKGLQNPPLHSFINQWYGVPYLMGGTTKLGVDCSAFVQELYNNVYKIPMVRTASQQFSVCTRIPKWENLKEGDLVFFKIKSKHISHVGVYLGNGKFVHASSSSGVMISDLTDRYWTKYYVGGGKINDATLAQGKI